MEFKQYLELLKKNLIFIIIFTLGGLAIAILASKNLAQNYSQSETLFVSSQQQTQNTQQDSAFYKEEEARSFTDTAVAVLQSPDFQNELSPNGSISTKKDGPQVLTITASAQTPEESTTLLKNAITSFNNKLAGLNNQQTILKEIGTPSSPSLPRVNNKIAAVAGLIFGAAAAVVAISFKTYLKL